jgi:hypothetical protein
MGKCKVIPDTKVCNKCKEEKTSEHFYLNKTNSSLSSFCKPCHAQYFRERYGKKYTDEYYLKNKKRIYTYQRNYYEENTEKVNTRSIAYYEKNKEKYLKHFSKFREDNPEAFKAYRAVQRAIKRGDLTRPTVCEVCARKDIPTEFHHNRDQYEGEDQLKGIFCCRSCHRRVHKGDQEIQEKMDKIWERNMETNHLVSFGIGLALSVIFIYFRYYHGIKGALRKYVFKYNLSTHQGTHVAAEWLRQQFLAENPRHRDLTTEEFIKHMKKILIYNLPTDQYEDGSFLIKNCSAILIAPPPTKEKPFIPPGWEDHFQ